MKVGRQIDSSSSFTEFLFKQKQKDHPQPAVLVSPSPFISLRRVWRFAHQSDEEVDRCLRGLPVPPSSSSADSQPIRPTMFDWQSEDSSRNERRLTRTDRIDERRIPFGEDFHQRLRRFFDLIEGNCPCVQPVLLHFQTDVNTNSIFTVPWSDTRMSIVRPLYSG